jgi:hypothetical protein
MQAAGIEVYPNPFSNVITIDGLKKKETLLLFDITGRMIQSWQATKELESFRTDGLAAGHYLLKIMTELEAVRVNVPILKE